MRLGICRLLPAVLVPLALAACSSPESGDAPAVKIEADAESAAIVVETRAASGAEPVDALDRYAAELPPASEPARSPTTRTTTALPVEAARTEGLELQKSVAGKPGASPERKLAENSASPLLSEERARRATPFASLADEPAGAGAAAPSGGARQDGLAAERGATAAAKAPAPDAAPADRTVELSDLARDLDEALGEQPEGRDAPDDAAGEAGEAESGTVASADDRGDLVRRRIDEILSRLDRRPGETPAAMFFRYWGDQPFVETSDDPLSTFGVDVDTASYTLTRAYLFERGVLPPTEAVRTEEFVNYFEGGYTPPNDDAAFAIHVDAAPTPLGHEKDLLLLRVGLKAREVTRETRKACSLVFVIDTSGSMRQGNRLETVKAGLRLLVGELDEGDRIGIVAFDRESRVILEPTSVGEKERILSAIDGLYPRSNTNLHAGMTLGYQMASRALIADGVNRVLLLSDGVANTGVTEQQRILADVEQERAKGIYLTTVGVGMANHNDVLMEQLADRGDGQCVYVDRVEEAQRAFVENLTGTLQTVAKDAKIQVELDPELVRRHRQIGYENRALADAAFRDNTVDAGEVGAGHEVTALYELALTEKGRSAPASAVVATVRVRYLTPEHGEAIELERKLTRGEVATSFDAAPVRFRLAACVAEVAEVLRDSYWSRGAKLSEVADRLQGLLVDGGLEDEHAEELVALARRAHPLVIERDIRSDEVAVVVDLLQENRYDQARLESAETVGSEDRDRLLTDLRSRSDELRSRLEELLAR